MGCAWVNAWSTVVLGIKRRPRLDEVNSSTDALGSANWWYNLSSQGLLVAGSVTALAAVAGIVFLFLQVRSSAVRDRYTDARTASIELQTRQVHLETVAAEQRIRELNVLIAEANVRTAEFQQRSEEDRLARVKLEQQIAPRRLTAAQIFAIKSAIIVKGCELYISVAHDQEALAFEAQLREVLVSAGCRIHRVGTIMAGNRPGLVIQPKGTNIEHALTAARVPAIATDWPPEAPIGNYLQSPVPHGSTYLTVGVRPLSD